MAKAPLSVSSVLVFLVAAALLAAPQINSDQSSAIKSSNAPMSSVSAHLAVARRDANFDDGMNSDRWNWRRWENNHLVVHPVFSTKRSFAAALYNEHGQMTLGVTVWMEGAKTLSIWSAAATRDGKLLVAGSFGLEGRTIEDFIGLADESGQIVKTIRTTPRVPEFICASGDHVWSYGWNRKEYSRGHRYQTLMEYSFESELLFSALEVDTVNLALRDSVGFIGLRCNDSQVVLLRGTKNELLRVDTATRKLTRIKYPGLSPKLTKISGMALTDSNDVFVGVRLKDSPMAGLFHFETQSDGTGWWSPVPETIGSVRDKDQGFATLVGSTKNEIVYLKPGYPGSRLYWAPISVDPKK